MGLSYSNRDWPFTEFGVCPLDLEMLELLACSKSLGMSSHCCSAEASSNTVSEILQKSAKRAVIASSLPHL